MANITSRCDGSGKPSPPRTLRLSAAPSCSPVVADHCSILHVWTQATAPKLGSKKPMPLRVKENWDEGKILTVDKLYIKKSTNCYHHNIKAEARTSSPKTRNSSLVKTNLFFSCTLIPDVNSIYVKSGSRRFGRVGRAHPAAPWRGWRLRWHHSQPTPHTVGTWDGQVVILMWLL